MELKFDDEVKALILLSSLPDSWSATMITVNSLSGQKKLKLKEIRDLILSKDIRRRESGEFLGASLVPKVKGEAINKGRTNTMVDRSLKGEANQDLVVK